MLAREMKRHRDCDDDGDGDCKRRRADITAEVRRRLDRELAA